jgi:predicted hotdog family 3-hydroxylacyl-ACP dehydratase
MPRCCWGPPEVNGFHPVEAYVPHRGAMLLIDRLLEAGPTHAVAEVTVPADGLFMNEGRMPGWVGLEYMAQAISAWSGVQHTAGGGTPRLGMLLGTRRYQAVVPDFAAGSVLRVEVNQEFVGDNGLGMFTCRILHQGAEVATARLSIYEPEDGETILKGDTP